MKTNQIKNMDPREIRVALLRKKVNQSSIAREMGVTSYTVYRVIEGLSASHRIREAIAAATGIDIKLIWPSVYLYGNGPRKRGRPFGSGFKKQQAA